MFKPFFVLYFISKFVQKLKRPKQKKIHDIFHLLLLEKNNINKNFINRLPKLKIELTNNKKH